MNCPTSDHTKNKTLQIIDCRHLLYAMKPEGFSQKCLPSKKLLTNSQLFLTDPRTTAKTQDISKINAKIMYLCYKKFLKPVPDFQKSVNMSCWRHYQANLMLFCG